MQNNKILIIISCVDSYWVWRSLVARLNGVQEAGSSNLLTQTTQKGQRLSLSLLRGLSSVDVNQIFRNVNAVKNRREYNCKNKIGTEKFGSRSQLCCEPCRGFPFMGNGNISHSDKSESMNFLVLYNKSIILLAYPTGESKKNSDIKFFN